MKKSTRMIEKTLEKLVEFNDEKDFLTVILTSLKNDYECEHLLRLIEKYDVKTADNVLIISILIGEAGDKTKRRGDYLKDIDSRVEGAMLEEDYDEYDEDDDDEGEKLKGFDEEEYKKELTKNDFCQILEDANDGDITAKWRLVNNIAMNKAESFADDYDLDKIYYDNLCDLAAEGKTAAYIMLGDAVLKGKGCEQNTKEAIRWYEKAAENGEIFGNECIGEIYYFGEYINQDYKKAFEYYTIDEGKKSYCTLYHLGEMYRQGLYVEKDMDKACEYYQDIVYNDSSFAKIDDYYWRACYRLGMALWEDAETESSLNSALRLLTEANELCGNVNNATDITKEEMIKNLKALEQEVKKWKKIRNEMPVIMKVRCVVEDEPDLTKGKIYEVLTEEDSLYGVVDDEDDGIYLYGRSCFEMINDKDVEPKMRTAEDSYNKLSLEFLKNYTEKQKGQNVVFSPFSVMVLLLMLADATDGESREEIISGVCKGIGFDEAKKFIRMLAAMLEDDGSFCSANAVCVKEKYKDKIKKQYKDALVNNFGGEMFASGDIVKAVNDWVRKNTKGMVDHIASEKNAEMISCFMNAVAFKAYWFKEYDDDDVKENLFYNADGSKQKVKMLSGTEYDYVEVERFTGFVKKYDSRYSFMALLPKKKSQDFLYESLNQVNFKNVYMAKVDEDVEIKLPEFEFSYEADMLDFCKGQGIETIFTNDADFTPMSDEWLKIESVAHKAIIKVDRNGTEATAVTYGVQILGCKPDSFKRKKKIVRLNRPFIFAIMHNETGLPVFVGVVNSVD